MKSIFYFMGALLASFMIGCATTPVALAPVGPNPVGIKTADSTGVLQVFSSLSQQSDNQNQDNNGDPVWYQHTDYDIYALDGTFLRHVGNTVGHYDEAPRRLVLPAGRYFVKAQAKDYLWVQLPVTIEPGRTTRVHLDDNWKIPANTPKKELVSLPSGNPVGWRD